MFCAIFTPAAFGQAASGTNLGTFSLLAESASQGNSLVVLYGKSVEGGQLTTYWAGPAIFEVVAAGKNYELIENLGGRCMTMNGAAVTVNSCTGATNQQFELTAQSDGSYVVQSVMGFCLSDAGSFTSAVAAACDSSAGERWKFSGATVLNLGAVAAPAPVVPAPVAPAPVVPAPVVPAPVVPAPVVPAPVAPAPAPAAPVAVGTSLGTFSLLDESASQGNALALVYGQSVQGGGLTTYWAGTPAFQVLSMGGSKYEIAETLGGRCLTAGAASITVQSCVGSPSQLFSLLPQSDGSYVVESGLGTCLSDAAAFTSATSAGCDGSIGERWMFSGSVALSLGAAVSAGGGSSSPAPVTATAPAVVNSPTVPAGYHLTFDDEFQKLSISDVNGAGTKWYTHTVQCCLSDTSNPSTPTYMAGIGDGPGKDPYSLVSGGLDIRLQKTNGAWYSGVISTVDGTGSGFSQKYGYFEMRANFPTGAGTWPAFWLLNSAALSQPGTPAGEIDVVESYMQFPTSVNTTLHDWSNSTTVGYKLSQTANLTSGFHTFGMLWTASTMTFYVDNVIVYTLPTPSIMNQAYYPIIDLGLGGGWPTNTTPQANDMVVQYMRVYSN